MATFIDLPKELVEEIFLNLSVQNITEIATTNKYISSLCSNEKFWLKYISTVFYINVKPKYYTYKEFSINLFKKIRGLCLQNLLIPTQLFSFFITENIDDTLLFNDLLDLSDPSEQSSYKSIYAFRGYKYFYEIKTTKVFTYLLNKYRNKIIDHVSTLPKYEDSVYDPDFYDIYIGIQNFNVDQIKLSNYIIQMIRQPTEYWFNNTKYIIPFNSMFPYKHIKDTHVKQYIKQYMHSLNIVLYQDLQSKTYQDNLNL
jgi:hypothetical protein